jgi:hypothetical protein
VVVVVLGRSPSAEVVGGRLVCREVGEAGRERPRGARRGWSGVEARREGGRACVWAKTETARERQTPTPGFGFSTDRIHCKSILKL